MKQICTINRHRSHKNEHIPLTDYQHILVQNIDIVNNLETDYQHVLIFFFFNSYHVIEVM